MIVVADPAVSDTAPDTAPEDTAEPCTVTVAPVDVTVGVTVSDATVFDTVHVYDVVTAANAGDRVP